MQLVSANDNHLRTLIDWFPNAALAREWSGPYVRFPMTVESLREDVKLTQMASRALLDDTHQLIGFGQFYDRLAHCHLGRLAIAPVERGQRRGEYLIHALAHQAHQTLGYTQCSLFVLSHNQPARKLYERLGFKYATYPDDMPLADCLYMTLDRLPT